MNTTTSKQTPGAYTSADGNARLVAEVFDALHLDGSVTYTASLCFETEKAIATVKRHTRLTWEEANEQVAFWTRLYSLTTF